MRSARARRSGISRNNREIVPSRWVKRHWPHGYDVQRITEATEHCSNRRSCRTMIDFYYFNRDGPLLSTLWRLSPVCIPCCTAHATMISIVWSTCFLFEIRTLLRATTTLISLGKWAKISWGLFVLTWPLTAIWRIELKPWWGSFQPVYLIIVTGVPTTSIKNSGLLPSDDKDSINDHPWLGLASCGKNTIASGQVLWDARVRHFH